MDMNLSFSVLTANIISILLIGTLYLANRQKAEYNRDMRLLQQMMVTIGIANISDCCVYYLAGSSNFKEADWTFKWRREVWKSKRSGKKWWIGR